MLQQIEVKMQAGYRCIKLKIGAINFEEELALLRHIRAHYSAREIELRVDANGAFSPADAMDKLNRLAELDLHSIEQPIRAGQWEEMARLAAESPLPIALDEELIGCNALERKRELLAAIHPRYIILKPSLHGGISGGNEWIAEAEKQHIGCAGVEYRSECHSPMVCDFPESVATRIRYRATVYGQCRDAPRDSKRLFMVLQIRGVGT